MAIIYVHRNYVPNVAGHTRVEDADTERDLATGFVRSGEHRFAVSVSNMFETGRSVREGTREGCVEFITSFQPLFCANPRLTEVQEIARYSSGRVGDQMYRVEDTRPFVDTPAQMWVPIQICLVAATIAKTAQASLRGREDLAPKDRNNLQSYAAMQASAALAGASAPSLEQVGRHHARVHYRYGDAHKHRDGGINIPATWRERSDGERYAVPCNVESETLGTISSRRVSHS